MNISCQYCGALKFPNEDLFKCCHNGKVQLPDLSPYPDELKVLLLGNSAEAKNFQTHIRQFNSAFSFASFGAYVVPPPGYGPPCFRICGQVCHRSGPLHPNRDLPPLYGQLYIYDGGRALRERIENVANHGCDENVMEKVQNVMDRESPYAAAYRHMAEVEQDENMLAAAENRPSSETIMYINRRGDVRRYNLPHYEEVAVIFVGNNGAPPDASQRDIVVYPRNQALRNISIHSSNLDPMIYPLFFPRGEAGWQMNMLHVAQRATAARNKVTMSQFYNYRLAVRSTFSPIHHGKKLFQQYAVDAYVKIEGQRIDYLKREQNKLRVETYQGVVDHLNSAADATGRQLGSLIILPSSFNGSPRAMLQRFQDAMAMIGKYGKPDLFITFTCNPNWCEIKNHLNPGEYANDRPDLVARVFHLKLRELLKDITERNVLGKSIANVHVIEFQKRGLPHVHLLLHLSEEDKLTEAEDIDSLICAELPDSDEQPQLFSIVKSCMIHGPCGTDNPENLCMVDGSCSKKYPKEFCETTNANFDGYPRYRRRSDGRTVRVKCGNGKFVTLDNRSVVPYCPWLTMKYNAHINVEACMSLKSVKYLYKYVYKGHDCANIEIDEILNHDEIKTYLDARYVSAPEAVWRIFEFPMHKQSHAIIRLPVHLPHCQHVYFKNGQEHTFDNTVEHSKLLAWFQLNVEDEHANQYLYTEISEHYVYDTKGRPKQWSHRKRGADKVITRMVSAKPSEGDRFFLRVLLLHVRGAKSFEDLRTVDGITVDTFREACSLLGLLQDDAEWHHTMEEAATFQMPRQLRQLFSVILIYCDPSDPLKLWDTFKEAMMEDFIHRRMQVSDAEQAVLAHIDRVISQHGKSLTTFNLPQLHEVVPAEQDNIPSTIEDVLHVRQHLNTGQLEVADAVLSAVHNVQNGVNQQNRLFYLDAPGGYGKTYTLNYLISEFKSMGITYTTCANSGIAATLLKGGCTVHKLFCLPVPVVDTSSCRISPTSHKADELRQIDVFLLDEGSMLPKFALEAIDRMLRDICNCDLPFGGKIFLISGDFRQLLPVLRNGRPAEIIEMCLKNSHLWSSFSRFALSENMRARPDEQAFCGWLLEIGNGSAITKQDAPFCGCVKVPDCCVIGNATSMINAVYDGVDVADYGSRAILTPTNAESLKINDLVLPRLPGEVETYYSADEIITDDDDDREAFTLEFINGCTPSGMPPHRLKLKVGVIVMLLRNLDLSKGLCNGTRLVVTHLHRNIIQCEILTGVAVGNVVLIPRLQLAPSDTGLPFQLSRRQFPLRLAYSMTINKSQGQTFEKVGLYFKRPCFSHGQLYVALSRARALTDIKVQVFDTNLQGECKGEFYTPNVVYRQVLN